MSRLPSLILTLVLLVPATAPGDASESVVRYDHDRLTVRATDAPIERILAEVCAATGAELRGAPTSRTIGADFEDVPLPEALGRLLGNGNFTLVYREDGSPRAIELLGAAAEVAATKPLAPPPPRPASRAVADLLANEPAVTLTPSLRDALGVSKMKLDELVRVVLTAERAGTRNDAMWTITTELDAKQDLRNAVGTALAHADDDNVDQLMERLVGAHADEVLRRATTDAKRQELQERAMDLVRRIRRPTLPAQAHPAS